MVTEKERERARRPREVGKAGRAVSLYANYFEVRVGCKKAHHYNLVVTPLPVEESKSPSPVPMCCAAAVCCLATTSITSRLR
jgi:hypothetical protein